METFGARDEEPVVFLLYGFSRRVSKDLDPVAAQLVFDFTAECRFDGWQHGLRAAQDGDLYAAQGEGVGHLKPYVAAADYHGRTRVLLRQMTVQTEAVLHGVEEVDAGEVEPRDVGPRRPGAGADHEPVVGEFPNATFRVFDFDGSFTGVHLAGGVICEDVYALLFYLPGAPVGQVAVVFYLPAQVEGQAADAIVWVGVGYHHGYLGFRVYLPGAQSRGYAGVAAADDEQAH